MNYFELRKVDPDFYKDFRLPVYLKNRLPRDKSARILDIGCGFGQMLREIRKLGYTNLSGVDIESSAVDHCLSQGLSVSRITDIKEYRPDNTFDVVIMSHVLEHIPKDQMIPTVRYIYENLLSPKGTYFVMVPNAQSKTGAYWFYEDFTHEFLFTSGSIFYVLKAAGFDEVNFLDPQGVEKNGVLIRSFKLFFLRLYDLNQLFWNLITTSSFHKPSPRIYSFELKVAGVKY